MEISYKTKLSWFWRISKKLVFNVGYLRNNHTIIWGIFHRDSSFSITVSIFIFICHVWNEWDYMIKSLKDVYKTMDVN